MSMKLFQYAVILHPTPKEREDGANSKILVPITTVLAMDVSAATLQAGRAISETDLDKLDRIEVAVRPF